MSAAVTHANDHDLSGAVAGGHEEDHEHHDSRGTTLIGFWIYLMSDCILFAGLFATYAVLSRSYAGGPTGWELFDLQFVAVETALLLMSSLTYGLAMISMAYKKQTAMLIWLLATFALGASFLAMEIYEFHHMIEMGAGPGRSAFLSAFFVLVGTHGLHIVSGLIWMATVIVQVLRSGLTEANQTRLMCLSLFWHFLDVVWIGVFSIVYLMGVLA